MPWRVQTKSSERFKLVMEMYRKGRSVASICKERGVSRKTGYKWKRRLEEEGRLGLEDRSRAPRTRPNALEKDIEELIVKLKRRHRWGARKLSELLASHGLGKRRPSLSTVSAVLERRGLVDVREPRPRVPLWQGKLTKADRCNRVWRADYKGYFRTADGSRIEPLTVTDGHSRYLLVLKRCIGTGEDEARRTFKAAFKRYGLPDVILTDNGSPFVTSNLTGLTRLSKWWVKLGIRHERIEPGRPYQNGSHERLHRTLKEATARPPAPTRAAQDRRFARFKLEYNEVRPHEALGQKTPASVYAISTRKMPARLPSPKYPAAMERRLVHKNGTLKWKGTLVYVGEVLAGETLGLAQDADTGQTLIHFYDRVLGPIARRRGAKIFHCAPPPPRRRRRAVKSKPRKV